MTEKPTITLLGAIKNKLIGTKQEWAREGRLLTGTTAAPGQRLPPGQREVTDWPILDLGIQPEIPRDAFRLTLDGLVHNPITLDWAGLMALPQTDLVADMHCVTQWSRFDNHWRGVSIQTLIDLVKPQPSVSHVLFEAHDNYITNLRLEQFAGADCLLVHQWNGAPISRQHGGPVRVMVPRYYLWKSAKWVRRISFASADQRGFWETRGYNNNADPWLEERYG
jgi:DMSO/TMAO reductase YedYZ molybdopterin-dependent catalytic subunit